MKDLQLLKDQWLSQKKPIMLFTLLGLPASGKTYFAEMIEEILENFFSDISIFDIDEIRHTHFGYSFDPDKEQKVRDILMKNVVEEIKKNRNKKNKNNIKQRKTQKDSLLHPSLKIKNALIIIDDVNYYNSMRHEFYQICKEYRCLYVPIYIKCPLKVCLERNKQRGKPIPQDLIKDMFQKFDEPGEKYAWDESLFVFQSHTQKLIDKIPELIDKIMERLGLWKKEYQEQEKGNIEKAANHNQLKTKSRGTEGRNEKQQCDQFTRDLIHTLYRYSAGDAPEEDTPKNVLNEIIDLLKKKKDVSVQTQKHMHLLSEIKNDFVSWVSSKNISPNTLSYELFVEFLKEHYD